MLPHLEAHFALVLVENSRRFWNSQNWVCDALQGLNHSRMFAIGVTLENLVTQMAVVSAAWERGDVNLTIGVAMAMVLKVERKCDRV